MAVVFMGAVLGDRVSVEREAEDIVEQTLPKPTRAATQAKVTLQQMVPLTHRQLSAERKWVQVKRSLGTTSCCSCDAHATTGSIRTVVPWQPRPWRLRRRANNLGKIRRRHRENIWRGNERSCSWSSRDVAEGPAAFDVRTVSTYVAFYCALRPHHGRWSAMEAQTILD